MEVFIDLKVKSQYSNTITKEAPLIVVKTEKVEDLKKKIICNFKLNIKSHRLGLSIINSNNKKIFLSQDSLTLEEYNFKDGIKVVVKDLGPQVGWRFVYVVEYIGPLLIFSLFYFFFNYNKSNVFLNNISFVMVAFHYSKRIFESIFIHKFSRNYMPLTNLFINTTYYWLLFGLLNGYNIYMNTTNNFESNNVFNFLLNSKENYNGIANYLRTIMIIIFFFAEYKNFKCHEVLKLLKVNNNGKRGIPYGHGFDLVTCANYFWEFISWLSFSLYINHWSSYLFCFAGLYIMSKWALDKHRNIKKLFGSKYPGKRKAIIPYIL